MFGDIEVNQIRKGKCFSSDVQIRCLVDALQIILNFT